MKDCMWTYNGTTFSLMSPIPEAVNPCVVAHALSCICRFNGHTNVFYSVAQHSLDVERIMREELDIDDPKLLLLGLLHDATEAYTGDLISPLKCECSDFREIESCIESSIYSAFKVNDVNSEENHRIVKRADKIAFNNEAYHLMKVSDELRLMILSESPDIGMVSLYEENREYVGGLFLTRLCELLVLAEIPHVILDSDWWKIFCDTGYVPLLFGDKVAYARPFQDGYFVVWNLSRSPQSRYVYKKNFLSLREKDLYSAGTCE